MAGWMAIPRQSLRIIDVSTHCSTYVFEGLNMKMKDSRWVVAYVFEVDIGMRGRHMSEYCEMNQVQNQPTLSIIPQFQRKGLYVLRLSPVA